MASINKKSATYQLLDRYGKSLISEMQTRLRTAGKIASGTLYNSLKYTIEINSDGGLLLSIEGAPYLDYVDKGRKPGKMPPVDQIKKWCKIKSIPEEAAWPIAINIGKYGIAPTNFFTISIKRRQKQFEKQLAEALAQDAEVDLIKGKN